MFLKVISDIHIHEDKAIPSDLYTKFKTKETVLLVAGDLCSPFDDLYTQLLTKFSKDFEWVFVVAGNREYYNLHKSYTSADYVDNTARKDFMTEYSIAGIDDKIDSICKSLENCVYLNNSSYEYRGTIFYGGTLWYSIDTHREVLMGDQQTKLDLIRVNGKEATFDDLRHIGEVFVQRLEDIIKNNKKGKPIVVLSHFPPDNDSVVDSEFLEGQKYYYSDFFQNHLSKLFFPSVKYWCYGHTHVSQCKLVNQTILISNPYKNLLGDFSPSLEFFHDT